MFPNNTREEDMQVCGAGEQKLFCKDYVENIQVNLVLSAVGCFLVLLSLVREAHGAGSWLRLLAHVYTVHA